MENLTATSQEAQLETAFLNHQFQLNSKALHALETAIRAKSEAAREEGSVYFLKNGQLEVH